MFLAVAASLSLILAAEGATAPAKAEADAGKASDANPNEKICKTDNVVNSRIPKRICMTRAEWEQMAEDVRHARRSSANRASHCSDSGPC